MFRENKIVVVQLQRETILLPRLYQKKLLFQPGREEKEKNEYELILAAQRMTGKIGKRNSLWERQMYIL